MAISSLEPGRTGCPGEVLTAAREQVADLCDRLVAGWSDDELITGLEAAQQLKATIAAWEAMALAEADERELATKRLHYGSTADWYTHCAGVHRREGHRTVRHAHALTSAYAATLDAMRSGRTSAAQAAVVCEAVDQLPGSPDHRAEGETFLLDQSATLNATELKRAARHLVHVVDPDRTERRLEAELDREERAAHLQRFLSVVDDGMGGVRIKGRGSLEDGAILRAALLPLTRPAPAADPDDPTGTPETDPRDHGARMFDAIVQLAQQALDTNVLPQCHGSQPRLAITMDLQTLLSGSGTGLTEDGLELGPAAIRRLACDADIIPICLGSQSEVLDVGRSVRLVTAALWRALVARDKHCRFPACTRPPVMCHAHHIEHWINGGDTSLDNLTLLCGEHHRTIHHTPWQVRLNPSDRSPEFLPPPRYSIEAPEGASSQWIRRRPRLE